MLPLRVSAFRRFSVSAPQLAPRVLLFALALAALWLPILHLLSPQWSIYEQYSYGWAVPLLCLYLVWQRRRTQENAEISKAETLK